MNEKKSFNKNPANHALYHALMEALIEYENAMDKGVADIVKNHKRQHDDDDDDDDDDPSDGPNQGKKTKRKRTKDSESTKKPSTAKETSKGKASSKSSKTSKSITIEELVKEPIADVVMDDPVNTTAEDVYVLNRIKIENLTQDLLLGPAYNLLKEGDCYPFDLSKPLPLQGRLGHLTIAVDYFFNHDLEYLKTSDPEKIMRMTKMLKRGSSIREKGLYKFKEGNFVDLHLNDIDDMMLLAVQHKLFHLNDSDIVDFIVALRMFTKSLIIKRRVDDLQLGFESYQKKLNITAPQNTFLEIEFKELFTPSYKPPGNDEMSRRKWMAINKKRSKLMVEFIDKQMRERRIIRNLERLVGARELKMDYKLMTRSHQV
ncbi:hypothetical protein Tco_1061265 [Tanacetum coccineum]